MSTTIDEGKTMINEIIKHFGSQRNLAEKLGVRDPAISQWIKKGKIPPQRAVDIERLTDGKFKAVDILKALS